MATTRGSTVLVETTVLVDFLRGSQAAADYLDGLRTSADLACSVVTAAELIVGFRTRAELKSITQLLARFRVEPIVAADSICALNWLRKYYPSHRVGFHDCLLAAAAVRLRITVATLNVKHFRALPSVRVVCPY
jgi:predicted nucleic acid-binding protein